MNLMRLYFICFFAITLSGCCCKNKPNTDSTKIVFGSGGGFTGMVRSFSIDNTLWIKDQQEKDVAKASKKESKEINKKLSNSGFMNLSFDKPGNFYYFIEVTQNGKSNKITWNDQSKAPENILEIYQYLTQLTIKK